MNNTIQLNKVLLVGINRSNDDIFQYELAEMENLCIALGLEVVDTIIQNLDNAVPSTYLGSGKLLEVKASAESINVDYIVINDELSPVQFKNITNMMSVPVLDRTMLILEIFKERARTKEAVLQVELAEMKYQLPRLAGSYSRLSRLGGGGGGAGGARRGAGETKLELDRRHIEMQISKLKEELEDIVKARQISRKARIENEIPVVALVGYTNAGKSSTMNAILNYYEQENSKNVFVKNMLFATLETSTRKVRLPNNKEFLLTDTVGFVSKLPHHLVESFKSTLEEIKEADLIIHVVDASSPYLELQIETTNKVLTELGVLDIPTIYIFNKIDVVKSLNYIPKKYNPALYVSSITKEGYPDLLEYIEKSVFKDYETNTFILPYDRGDIYNIMKENGEIKTTEYLNEGILVVVTLSKYLTNKYANFKKK